MRRKTPAESRKWRHPRVARGELDQEAAHSGLCSFRPDRIENSLSRRFSGDRGYVRRRPCVPAGRATGDPEELVQAWRYVWKRFRASGATNAVWVWSSNWGSSPNEAWNDLHVYYPGDRYVDWVGVDFYGLKWEDVPVLDQLDSAYADFAHKPVMIGETATADCANYVAGATHTKDQWIRAFFAALKSRPAVRAFCWFNIDKE
ncbi:MAG: glycosyl hydrolase, partial [Gaiellaceae bacterium]